VVSPTAPRGEGSPAVVVESRVGICLMGSETGGVSGGNISCWLGGSGRRFCVGKENHRNGMTLIKSKS